MNHEYSEDVFVQNSARDWLRDELGWEVAYAYNAEKLGENGTFGRKLWHYFQQTVMKLNPLLTEARNRLLPKLMSGKIEV